jgi:3-hydroxybutyryl-CoA dehydrogenase
MAMFTKIAVIGAGTMGNGITHVFAQYGARVHLIDVNADQLLKALQTIQKNLDRQLSKGSLAAEEKEATYDRISTFSTLEEGLEGVQLVVEAATENEAVKLKIFQELDRLAAPDAILASNTSSISITKIAAVTKRPTQVIGMHFMNPVPVMKLVEIINGYATAASVTATIVALTKSINKTPCVVNDYPGFIANRILMPMINEAIYSLYEGVATVTAIDDIMKLGMAHPMGPLQLADFIGLDVCHSILQVLQQGLGNNKYAPCPLLSNMVAAGKLGVKSGEGFYIYSPENKTGTVSQRFN